MAHWVSAHLNVASPIYFPYHFSDALKRSNPPWDFVCLVALMEYAVSVLTEYLQAAQNGVQSYTRSFDCRPYSDSSTQPTRGQVLPLLV